MVYWIGNEILSMFKNYILFSDYESDFHDLLDSIGGQTHALRSLKFMLLEVYKCIKKVDAPCLHN